METKTVAQSAAPASPAEARAHAIAQLCDGFSHDTRNPLNAVVIHLEVLSDKLKRSNNGEIPLGLEKNLKAIRDQVGRIDEMVRRFVELAAPHRQHEPEFDLGALVESVVAQCTHQARLARSELRAETSPGLRIAGSAAELGVALALYLMGQVEHGAKRLVVRTESQGSRALLVFEGTVAADRGASASLERVAESLSGSLAQQPGRTELALELGAAAPALRVVSEGVEGAQ